MSVAVSMCFCPRVYVRARLCLSLRHNACVFMSVCPWRVYGTRVCNCICIHARVRVHVHECCMCLRTRVAWHSYVSTFASACVKLEPPARAFVSISLGLAAVSTCAQHRRASRAADHSHRSSGLKQIRLPGSPFFEIDRISDYYPWGLLDNPCMDNRAGVAQQNPKHRISGPNPAIDRFSKRCAQTGHQGLQYCHTEQKKTHTHTH